MYRSGLKSNVMFIQVAHHASRGIQAKSAAARQQDSIYALYGIDRIQQIRLACTGRRASHIHASDCTRVEKNHRAAGGSAPVSKVTHSNIAYIGDAAVILSCFSGAQTS